MVQQSVNPVKTHAEKSPSGYYTDADTQHPPRRPTIRTFSHNILRFFLEENLSPVTNLKSQFSNLKVESRHEN